jgi:hypothetical protein
MVEAIRSKLEREMERDQRVMVLGEDVGRSGGVFRATDGLQARFGPDRVVDMPVAEAAIVGASIGLATAGLVPVAELQFLGFAYQAYHQIAGQLGRMRARASGRFGVQVTVRAPYGGGVRAPELHSDACESVLAHCPGLKVVAPATAADAKGLLATAIRDPDPVIYLEPLKGYRLVRDKVPSGEHLVPFGQARVARAGEDVTVVPCHHAAAGGRVGDPPHGGDHLGVVGLAGHAQVLRQVEGPDEEHVQAGHAEDRLDLGHAFRALDLEDHQDLVLDPLAVRGLGRTGHVRDHHAVRPGIQPISEPSRCETRTSEAIPARRPRAAGQRAGGGRPRHARGRPRPGRSRPPRACRPTRGRVRGSMCRAAARRRPGGGAGGTSKSSS